MHTYLIKNKSVDRKYYTTLRIVITSGKGERKMRLRQRVISLFFSGNLKQIWQNINIFSI